MFGESESESPRVPSPWDSLISSPPSPAPLAADASKRTRTPSPLAAELIPQLVPESDDGNVEYKLQLLSPSPARFARLVTQMKWRLLEGGGQAYYELGVADSGHLVGLPREELEQSLETLEMMAGEIGASVIVVKEIEVPPALVGLAATQNEWGAGTSKRRKRRDGIMRDSLGDFDIDIGGYSTSTTGTSATAEISISETDTISIPDLNLDDSEIDYEDDLSMTVVLRNENDASGKAVYAHHRHLASLNHRNNNHNDSPGVFSMDLLEPDAVDSGNDADVEADDQQAKFSIKLEISSVFKPRPMRTRIHNSHVHPVVGSAGKNKRPKKHKHANPFNGTSPPAAENGHASSPLAAFAPVSAHEKQRKHTAIKSGHGEDGDAHIGKGVHGKGYSRRHARDRRREEKRKALLAIASQSIGGQQVTDPDEGDVVETSLDRVILPLPSSEETESLVSGLESLQVKPIIAAVPLAAIVDATPPTPVLFDEPLTVNADTEPDPEDNSDDDDVFPTPTAVRQTFSSGGAATTFAESHLDIDVGTHLDGASAAPGEGSKKQPYVARLIVEALVVRKMSLGEAFLDFGGFSMI